ncbi:alpha/beta fold hydrolase [Variovorax sp. Sphag1AA]|uniref:alpha/beta fold hydrolase n=1 Tax=Variovorax sp. Sphag1AA TaxID=2587027 RepID=UPI001610C3B8|nr:alpha/beta fold hydrolase [Variovorax sp. Sphag1AA]MBB3175867.1 polyhydroxyalkanoate synthase [Variovorax sp. Sphag1AA]
MSERVRIRSDLVRTGSRLSDSFISLAAAVCRRPFETIRALQRSSTAVLKATTGFSKIEPAAGDRRFDDPTWTRNPVYRALMQSHLALAQEVHRMAGELDLSPRDEARAHMALGMVADTLAPTNTLVGNPAAIRRTLETGGRNLFEGARQLAADWRDNGGLPSMVDGTQFGVGSNLAVTPGAVVHRHEMLELIEYKAQTKTVHGTPLFIVPPQINKYYIWDLAPGRSLIEYLVQQGFQVFVVSWFDPGADQSEWGLQDYVLALEEAMQTVREISRSRQMHVLGACSGGITSAALLAYLQAKGSDWARSLTLLVSLLDIGSIADSSMGLFAHLETLELARTASGNTGVLQGKDLAKVFAWLRPNELVWNYWVNNYLMGEKPPTFDILYWNSDTTRLPARLHADFISLLETNALAHEGGLSIGELPLSLSNVGCDSYIVAGRTDHITPWEGCYQTRNLLGGLSEFVLTSSGHVQSIVTPPGGKKASFMTNAGEHDSPQGFEAGAQTNEGSWWPHLSTWLAERSDAQRRAPVREGSRKHPPLCDAPGTYVLAGNETAAAE